jgi:hypothetical protein
MTSKTADIRMEWMKDDRGTRLNRKEFPRSSKFEDVVDLVDLFLLDVTFFATTE